MKFRHGRARVICFRPNRVKIRQLISQDIFFLYIYKTLFLQDIHLKNEPNNRYNNLLKYSSLSTKQNSKNVNEYNG